MDLITTGGQKIKLMFETMCSKFSEYKVEMNKFSE